jgi:hypothetical protein
MFQVGIRQTSMECRNRRDTARFQSLVICRLRDVAHITKDQEKECPIIHLVSVLLRHLKESPDANESMLDNISEIIDVQHPVTCAIVRCLTQRILNTGANIILDWPNTALGHVYTYLQVSEPERVAAFSDHIEPYLTIILEALVLQINAHTFLDPHPQQIEAIVHQKQPAASINKFHLQSIISDIFKHGWVIARSNWKPALQILQVLTPDSLVYNSLVYLLQKIYDNSRSGLQMKLELEQPEVVMWMQNQTTTVPIEEIIALARTIVSK